MLFFEKPAGKERRKWTMFQQAEGGEKRKVVDLQLEISSITNRFEEHAGGLYRDMSLTVPGFEDWMVGLIEEYIRTGYDCDVLLKSTEKFLEHSAGYYNQCVESGRIKIEEHATNPKRTTKTSIRFDIEDIRAIGISTTALKLYSIFCYSIEMAPTANPQRTIYHDLIRNCTVSEPGKKSTIDKIFELTRTRIYKSTHTDKLMWEWIRTILLVTPDSYVMSVFNFLMTNILATISIEMNPIPYLIKVIDGKVRWMMRTVYKDRIMYGEAFNGADDLYGGSLSKESFYLLCCNDLMIKAAGSGIHIVEMEYKLTDDQFGDLQGRISSLQSISSMMKFITFPIISKILGVPVRFLMSCSPRHAMAMSILAHYLTKDLFKDKLWVISEFLLACPKDQTLNAARSAYKIRDCAGVLNSAATFNGFTSKVLMYNLISGICGILNSEKRYMISVLTGDPLAKMSNQDLEDGVITFLNGLYSHAFDPELEKIAQRSETLLCSSN